MKLQVDFVKCKNGYVVWVLGDGEDLAQSEKLPDELQCWVYLENVRRQLEKPIESIEINFKHEDFIDSMIPFVRGEISETGWIPIYQSSDKMVMNVTGAKPHEREKLANYTVKALNNYKKLYEIAEALVIQLNEYDDEHGLPEGIDGAQHELQDFLGDNEL